MNNSQFLINVKDSILRNQVRCNINQLKDLVRLYTFDTKAYSKINKPLLEKCNTVEDLLQFINLAIVFAIDEECENYGGLVANTTSITNRLLHIKPAFIDLKYTYDEQDIPVLLSSFIIYSLQPYVNKGISEEYFNNFKNKLYACESYDEIVKFVDSVIENGKKYAKEH